MKCVFIYFSHSLFVYVFILCPEMFSGTVSDYLFIHVFYYFQKSRNVMFSGTVHFARQVHLSGQFLKQTSQCLE